MLCFFILVYFLPSLTCSQLLSRHKRAWIIDSFTIEESHPGPFPYELGKINIERNYSIMFDLIGEGVDEEPRGVLSIEKETGIIYVHKAVDYEQKTKFTLRFEAMEAYTNNIDTKLGVEIQILDINDNPPRFQMDLYEINITPEVTQGSQLVTVMAHDRDKAKTQNSSFHYEIKSVSPHSPNAEFFIGESGNIYFKGCLNYEAAEKFTVLVEAKDHGEVVSLSSSTTVVLHVQDRNNHLPVITRQTGSGRVKEGETGVSPLRLHVTDGDTPDSPAWRTKYTIQGDEGGHFMIETDPETNDGVLTVVMPLDFEEGVQRQLSISVKNEAPYFTCTVKERTSSGLWRVETSSDSQLQAGEAQTVQVLIEVEDVNDPPVFSVTITDVMLEENAAIGTWVDKVTAVDPDSSHARDFVFKVGEDPEGWVTVDPHTGDITTVKSPDRESPHVVNNIYTVVLHAVDNGEPPQTGTATLNIHVKDLNDNVPQLSVDRLDVCLSDGPTTTNITAFDLDENPFGGPFRFELLGDVERKWKLNPSYGFAAGLVRESAVYAGDHIIELKISGMQGEFGIYKISVRACDCTVTQMCPSKRMATTKDIFGAVAVVFASVLLFVVVLLSSIVVSCRKEFKTLQVDHFSEGTLIVSNLEKPGTDCEISNSFHTASDNNEKHDTADWKSQQFQHYGMACRQVSTKNMQHFKNRNYKGHISENFSLIKNWNQTNCNYSIASGNHNTYKMVNMSTMAPYCRSRGDATLQALLHQRVSSVLATEDELRDYHPHVYVDDGDSDTASTLDSITISDNSSFQEAVTDLGPKFNELASICQPQHAQN